MMVGVEGIPIFGDRSGVGQYTKRLVEAASKLDSNTKFEVIRQLMPLRKLSNFPIEPNPHLSYRIVRWLPPVIYYQLFKRVGWTLPYDLVVHRKYDAVLFFNFVAYPTTRKVKSIIVIHDLSYIYHKKFVSPKNQEYLEKFVPRSIARADKIIAISENTRTEVSKYYGVPKSKITIINPAVDHSEFKPQERSRVEEIKSKYGIKKPYILSVGTIEPRKNLIGTLNAFEMLPESIKSRYTLVLAGGEGWLNDEIEARYQQLSEQYSLIKTGYVSDSDLPPLYAGAEVFVFPTFYEGFGMPPLEAMACGTPVISADNSSLPEVVGDAAIKVKAEDTAAISKAIERILTDADLAGSLRQKGFAQAKKFSWEKSARVLIELLDSLKD
jgi:glycosyltransferase involved in cell wall biosynthesis